MNEPEFIREVAQTFVPLKKAVLELSEWSTGYRLNKIGLKGLYCTTIEEIEADSMEEPELIGEFANLEEGYAALFEATK